MILEFEILILHGFFYYKEQEENVLTFDKIVARMSLMDYNKNRTDVLFARSAKTCAVAVRTSVLTERPLH